MEASRDQFGFGFSAPLNRLSGSSNRRMGTQGGFAQLRAALQEEKSRSRTALKACAKLKQEVTF